MIALCGKQAASRTARDLDEHVVDDPAGGRPSPRKLLDKRVSALETEPTRSFRTVRGRCTVSTTQQQVAEVFERRVVEVGYDKANLDDVAREMKISKKTIYVHFASKREIYAYIVERQAAREKMRLAASVATLPTYAARLEAVMNSMLSMARNHIAETSEEEWLHEYEIAADAFSKANGDLIRELVQAGMDAGEFPAGDASLVERMLAAMMLDYVQMVNADPSYDRDAELIERVRRFVG
jgi:AcrR family transcriptional regulator